MPLVWGLLVLSPLWSRVHLREDIDPERHQKWQIVQALDYMRAMIPPGSLIFYRAGRLSTCWLTT